jgi:ribosomal protein L22
MVKKYCAEPQIAKKAAKAQGSDIRVHYKNTFEVGRVLRGQNLVKAK